MLATVTVNVNCAGIPVSWLTKVFNQIQVRDSLLCLPLLKQSFRMLSRKKEERKKTHTKNQSLEDSELLPENFLLFRDYHTNF